MTSEAYMENESPQHDCEVAWERCLAIIKDNIAYRTFQTWFEPIRAVSLQDSVLTLQVPSQFFYEWLEEHYVALLGKTIKRVLGKDGRLEYRIMMEGHNRRNPASINMPASTQPKVSAERNMVDLPFDRKTPFDPNPYVKVGS